MKTILVSLFIAISIFGFGQKYAYLSEILLETEEDYKEHEELVLECKDYLMAHPIDDDDLNRRYCGLFIVNYALGSPTITISLDNLIMKLVDKKNSDLLTYYFALWMSEVIENPGKDVESYEVQVYSAIANYCANEQNNVRGNKGIKSLVQAAKEGKIKEWIDSNRE